ncbi:BRCA2 and CDKN1A-interacting protein [Vairimorpha necatrix]|uniref:BRCA2 and CDKN1A-interacting protein n=1 Tax=Vairimorpha necatrix TaxID=6039 RepID=A0AAX4J9W0_9MICR
MSSYSSSDNSEEYISSESETFECSLISEIPMDDFCFLLTRCKFFSDPDKLVFVDKVFVVSNDIVLYYILFLDYNKIISLVDKKVKKHINALTNKKDIILVYIDKLCNINIQEIVKAYKHLNITDTTYIVISKCYNPAHEEKEEFKELFPDYKESLEVIPVRIEEIFLSEFSKKKNFTLGGFPFQLCLIEGKDMKKYIEILEKEVEQK